MILQIGLWMLALPFIFEQNVSAQSDPPELMSWLRNTNGKTGYNSLPADVQTVRYTGTSVYVNSTGIPAYTIGPWPGNPNTPTNQGYVCRIPRQPAENTGAKTPAGLGAIGMWINGVPIYNALDGMSHLNQNIWHQNAAVVEAPSFDACKGHPAPGGRYHHHQNPVCLYTDDTTSHSPLLGFAFDGYPVYGPRGFQYTDGSGGISRMTTSYRLRNITQRHTLPDSTVLSPSQYGPDVSTTYPLGYYAEDFEYVQDLGVLDRYNGRSAVTPEYPSGTYAYWVTINQDGTSAYPYTIGPRYVGVVAADNIPSPHVTVPADAVEYDGATGVAEFPSLIPQDFKLSQNYPNPFSATGGSASGGNPATVIEFTLPAASPVTIKVYNTLGQEVGNVLGEYLTLGNHRIGWNARSLAAGTYFYRLTAGKYTETKKLILAK
ncbi:MAG TPA: YHYH protein [Bacteroidota bacterium]|nr:YHYH protein [Bacteroidota bacterium]